MSHPDASHDPENVQEDDRFDYQQQQDEERRKREDTSWHKEYESWCAWVEETRKQKGE